MLPVIEPISSSVNDMQVVISVVLARRAKDLTGLALHVTLPPWTRFRSSTIRQRTGSH